MKQIICPRCGKPENYEFGGDWFPTPDHAEEGCAAKLPNQAEAAMDAEPTRHETDPTPVKIGPLAVGFRDNEDAIFRAATGQK